MATFQKILSGFGLNETETTVFSTLVDLGSASAQSVASNVNMNRITVYQALRRLQDNGLVTRRQLPKKKSQIFIPVPYSVLQEKFEARAQRAAQDAEAFLAFKPMYESKYAVYPKKPSIEFFEGRRASAHILKDTLAVRPKEILSFASSESLDIGLTDEELQEYWDRRTKLKIPTRGILPDTPEARAWFTDEKNQAELRRLKFVNPKFNAFRNEIDIYGDNVSVMIIEPGNEHGFIIRSRSVAESWRAVFEMVWNLA